MRRRRSRLKLWLAAFLGVVALLGVAWVVLFVARFFGFGPVPAGGDPGNRALHLLAADPIFVAVPSGASSAGLRLTPAKYQGSAFESGGWTGANVTRTFTSRASDASVYSFYAAQSERRGWTVATRTAAGLAIYWRKVYPNGDYASLGLIGFDPRDRSPHLRTYELVGSIQADRGGRPRNGRNSP